MSTHEPLKIAIIGGGLAGATLMNALLHHPHLQVDLFESAPEFSERGAAVGIAQNGQAALAEIGGGIATALDRARAVTMSSSRMCMVRYFMSEATPAWYLFQCGLVITYWQDRTSLSRTGFRTQRHVLGL